MSGASRSGEGIDMRQLAGRTVAITGAASGIGESLARLFATQGCHLALADLQIAALTALKEELNDSEGRVSIHEVDVADAEQVKRFATEAIEHHEAVHILINNAGITYMGNFLAHDLSVWDRIVGVNLMGVVYGCHAFIPHLLTLDQAHIVNISSIFGIIGVPGQSAYCSTKFAVRGLSEALSAELSESNVGVTVVHPGGIATNIVHHSDSANPDFKEHMNRLFQKKMMHPDRAALLIMKAIQSKRHRLLITPEAKLGDRLKRWMPVRGGVYFVNKLNKILRLNRYKSDHVLSPEPSSSVEQAGRKQTKAQG